jgi:hypothetical protein
LDAGRISLKVGTPLGPAAVELDYLAYPMGGDFEVLGDIGDTLAGLALCNNLCVAL